MIELTKIRIDGGTQPRAELNQDTVAEYSEAYKAGERLPPVKLFFDGSDYWMADGFHRYFAAKSAGKKSIQEDITPGSKRDAVLFSLSANAKHGLKRNNADKRRAVQTLLADPEWAQWSSREIARQCAVSHEFVSQVRDSYLSTLTDSQPSHLGEFQDSAPETRTVQRNGTTYEQDVSGIGRGKSDEPKPEQKPKPKLLSEEESARILAENERLKEIAETCAADAREATEDNESLTKIFEADDQLASALKEIERQKAEIRVLRTQLNGSMNKCSELNRLLTTWKRKAEKLEKQIKQAGGATE